MEIRKSPYNLLKKWITTAEGSLSERQGAVLSNVQPQSMAVTILYVDDAGIIFRPHYNTIPGHPAGKCCLFFWQTNGKQVSVIGNVSNLNDSMFGKIPKNTQYSHMLYYYFKKIVRQRGLLKAISFFLTTPECKNRSFYLNAYILKAETFEFVKAGLLSGEYKRYELKDDKWIF
jgi:hypothetical protein